MKVVAESVKMNDSVTVDITQNDGIDCLIGDRRKTSKVQFGLFNFNLRRLHCQGARTQTSVWGCLISTYEFVVTIASTLARLGGAG
jgi:hypothetical protein